MEPAPCLPLGPKLHAREESALDSPVNSPCKPAPGADTALAAPDIGFDCLNGL